MKFEVWHNSQVRLNVHLSLPVYVYVCVRCVLHACVHAYVLVGEYVVVCMCA